MIDRGPEGRLVQSYVRAAAERLQRLRGVLCTEGTYIELSVLRMDLSDVNLEHLERDLPGPFREWQDATSHPSVSGGPVTVQ